jgi:hypothetical protein
MTGYETFCLYHSLKLHFTTDNYNYFKYLGKSRISVESFEKRKDKYQFYKLSRKIKDDSEMKLFLISNILENPNLWVGSLLTEESNVCFQKKKRVIQSLSYVFQDDCIRLFSKVTNPNELIVCDENDPILLKKVLQKEIEFETLCILNRLLNFLPLWSRKIQDTIRWPEFKRSIVKYSEFIEIDDEKYRNILKRCLNECFN